MSDTGFLAAGAEVRHRTVLRNVYLWMSVGLAVTAAVSWYAVQPGNLLAPIVFGQASWLIMIALIVTVIALTANIMKMSTGAAVGGFLLYSVLNGMFITRIIARYSGGVVFQAFAVTAGMFIIMSLWAVTTRRDLSGWGHYLFMGLIGLIITGVVGIFIGGESFSLLFSAVGVILFTLLTAYDTQRIKRMSDEISGDLGEADYVRLSILGALKLYMDFISMFLFLLRIFGRRR